MRTVVPLAVAAASVLLLAGCGTEGPGGDPGGSTSGSGAAQGETELTVVVRTGAGQGNRTFLLTCDPPGGDHPDPEAACRGLDELEQPFAPVPADTACTEIYGGPQTARVTGTYRGDPVDAEFDRTNGCQIDRWDAHLALLVEAGGA